MTLRFYICGDDPRMLIKIKDKMKADLPERTHLVVEPFFNTTPEGRMDLTKVDKYIVLDISDDFKTHRYSVETI